ncbi:DUF2637 domain-containing protein [Streptomyces sp. NPDC051664]|uniref:DUF2637 domain-containing protein n=1 Tax=Streptomyces sp. NPDC051664 TaxID=3365668 RepID=UPI00379DD660
MTRNRPTVLLTRAHRILIGVVVAGAAVIAAIGFAGSYAAVRALAEQKGFGNFSLVFPIGIDAGICVLLALDLLLTWMRIPFPLLRQTAWLLTAATIAFNGAAAWPDPLGVGMHAVIPVLFVVAVEAARHAVGRIADLTADKHMEGVRLTRWLLSPIPTFKLWRRMKLWELRSYEQVIKLEQDRLIYQARLQARFGRNWRRKAPVESLMPLRLAKFGVPLVQTAPAGLAAAGIEVPVFTVEQVGVEHEDPMRFDHERALSPGESTEAGGHHEQPETTASDVAPEQTPAPGFEPVDYAEAVRGYVAQHGEFPNARQFGLFLASYGVTDPTTGGPWTEALLRPLLQELRQHDGAQGAEPVIEETAMDGWMADQQDRDGVADRSGAWGESAAHPAFGESSVGAVAAPQPRPSMADPVPVPTAAVATDRLTDGGVPQQMSLDAPASQTSTSAGNATAEQAAWVATATGTGEATARVPEQQHQEPELDSVQQQILTVAGWIDEADDAGEKLSGAEVGRRLGVAPRTGQRRLDKAMAYRDEQLRQSGRAHLRSVTNRP